MIIIDNQIFDSNNFGSPRQILVVYTIVAHVTEMLKEKCFPCIKNCSIIVINEKYY